MKNDLSCKVIKDLLPTYIDELGSSETNKCVKEHLSKCHSCRKEYENICKNNSLDSKHNEIEALIRFKKRIKRMFILTILISLIFISFSLVLSNVQDPFKNSSELIVTIIFKISVYGISMLALFVSWLWKKAAYGSKSYNISSTFFISMVILNTVLIIGLFSEYGHLKYIGLM